MPGDAVRTLAAVPTGTADVVTIIVARHALAHRPGHVEHIPKIGEAVLVGRRADSDHHDLADRDRTVGGERQTARP